MNTKIPLAYWQLIVQVHQNLDSGDSQLDDFAADCNFRQIKQKQTKWTDQPLALGPLEYNGGKAKHFQQYKKVKDLQFKVRYGEHGEFISTGELYESERPKAPTMSKALSTLMGAKASSNDQNDDD